jgi:hypothetical protein
MVRHLLPLLILAVARPVLADGAAGPTQPGAYGGVVPGQPRTDDAGKHHKHPPHKGTLSWVGFQAKDGGADVFLQSIAPFETTQHLDHGALIVDLAGLTRLGQNTWRPIDTRFFDSPLARIVARKIGRTHGKHAHPAGIEVRITFKDPKQATQAALRSATEADGYYYAYLTFAGTSSAADAAGGDPEK